MPHRAFFFFLSSLKSLLSSEHTLDSLYDEIVKLKATVRRLSLEVESHRDLCEELRRFHENSR